MLISKSILLGTGRILHPVGGAIGVTMSDDMWRGTLETVYITSLNIHEIFYADFALPLYFDLDCWLLLAWQLKGAQPTVLQPKQLCGVWQMKNVGLQKHQSKFIDILVHIHIHRHNKKNYQMCEICNNDLSRQRVWQIANVDITYCYVWNTLVATHSVQTRPAVLHCAQFGC